MFLTAVLFSFVFVVSATGLECMIYVSSSDGINNTSCWTGGYQTPCATLDLALQGTVTVQDKCSSGTVINLSPGNYTLDTTTLLEQQLLRNNVSIIGMRNDSSYEEVNVTCLHESTSWRYIVFQCVSLYNCNNLFVSCTHKSFNHITQDALQPRLQQKSCSLALSVNFRNLPLQCSGYSWPCECENLQFTVSIIYGCTNEVYDWKNDLRVCVLSNCYIVEVISFCPNPDITCTNPYDVRYHLHKTCFNMSTSDSMEVSLYIETLDVVNINTNIKVDVKTECSSGESFIDGECQEPEEPEHVTLNCNAEEFLHLIPADNYTEYYNGYVDIFDYQSCPYCTECCYNEQAGHCYLNCTLGSSIHLKCVECEDYHNSLLLLTLIEILYLSQF